MIDYIKTLDSVGYVFNTSSGMLMMVHDDGTFNPDYPIHISNFSDVWFNKLSPWDLETVKTYLRGI